MRTACLSTCGLILFFLLPVAATFGQPKGKVEHYSTENGLSHRAVTSIIKDREGFMWFGSWDGINRFDGHTFVSYKSFPGNNSQLGNDRVDQILEDQSNHLWIRAYDLQVYRFDKKSEQFLPLSPIINQEGPQKITFSRILLASNGRVWLQSSHEGIYCVSQTELQPGQYVRYAKELPGSYHLPSNANNFFHEDNEKRIWIGTPGGLSCLTPDASGTYLNSHLTIPGGNTEYTTCQEDTAHLYFGTGSGHLVIYNKKNNTFSQQKIAADRIQGLLLSRKAAVVYATTSAGAIVSCNLHDQTITTARYQPAEQLFSIYEDRKGCLWVEPQQHGIICFDPAQQSFKRFRQQNIDRLVSIGNHAKVWEDNNGLVWVFMKRGGFGYYDHASGSFDYLVNTPDAGSTTLPANVYFVYHDQEDVFWVTNIDRQLVRIILQDNVFEQRPLVQQSFSRYDNEVRGILYDKNNRLWVGSKSGALYVYQNGKPVTGLFDNEPAEGLGVVYSMMQDSRGNIWLGTKGNGLYKAVPVNPEQTVYHLVHLQHDKNNGNGLPCNEIYAMLEDRQQRVWIGSFDKGLFLVQEHHDSIQLVQTGDAFTNYPRDVLYKIRHMALDAAGNIWMGTTNGLLLLDANDAHNTVYRYTPYRKIPGDRNSLGKNDIQFIYRDARNRMWLATSGGGFCGASGDQPFRSLQFRNYTTRNGMPNDYVLSCAEDRQGNLWIATENGLSRFNPQNNSFRNYDFYDGLPRASFSEAAACTPLPGGQLVFGTTKGLLAFEPGRINNHRITAGIAFTNVQINNEDAGPGMNETVLKNDINYIDGLTLQHHQNIISIDYAILDQRAGNRHALVYRLLGFDSAWHEDRQQRRATYTNLPPGQYVFEVKSLSSDLYSNIPYKSLTVTILPPPWKTWWAYTLYVLFTGVLLFFIRRYALAMIRLRHKMAVEQKLATLKANFFTNVSHELRTPLTLIINPLEQIAKKETLSAEGAALVEVVRKNASRLVRFINQLLDLRKIESNKATLHIARVDMVSFVKNISDHFTAAIKTKHITFEIFSEQPECMVWVDAEKMDVVIYNLLANAVKFTPAGKTIRVMIQLLAATQHVVIAVSDQGPGVDPEKLNNIFELFYEGDQPAARDQKGSGIGLALSKELVNLHGGTIRAENNEDGGLTVSIQLKLGFSHYQPHHLAPAGMPQTHPDDETQFEQQPLSTILTAASPANPQAPLVLLVEDNDELRAFLQAQLGEWYRVEVATNGEEGWQKAGNLLPDLVLSDIMMPVMDGIQMLDKIKNDINTSHIPVVLLSAKHAIESQVEGLRYGADYYITKPFHNEFLIAAIDNLLRQRKKLFDMLVHQKPSVDLSPAPIVITSGDETFLKTVIQVVEEKMTDAGFQIETVAESMHMSRTTFYKKFKSLTGLTPVEFVRDMRLQRARQYLDAGHRNIAEVAYWSGFNHPKYFSTCFREKYQVSPSDYLKAKAG